MNGRSNITDAELVEEIEVQLLDEFNKLMGEFIIKMIKALKPYKKQLKTAYNTFVTTLAAGQKSIPLLHFWKYAKPFKSKIMNDSRIIAEDFVKTSASGFDIFEGVDLAEAWEKIPEETQNAMISYFQGLFTMAEGYHDKDKLVKIGEAHLMTQTVIQNTGMSSNQMNDVLQQVVNGQASEDMKESMSHAASVIDMYVKQHGRMPRGQEDFKELVAMAKEGRMHQAQMTEAKAILK
jgi:lipopolysaccharide biosynthesis glycosyltransferase